MGRSCSHIDCFGPCKKAKKKIPTRIPRFSKKRQKENRKYSTLRKQFLEDKECAAKLEGCTGVASQVHHKSGRVGEKLLDVRTWLPVCAGCHNWIELHPSECLIRGLSKSRLNETDK
jgi:hypothetical protein